MCISCGCGKPNDDHGDPRNITLQDIDAAAQSAGTTRDKILENISTEGQRYLYERAFYSSPSSTHKTGEANSAQPGGSQRQSGGSIREQEGYNPAQSGAQPSHKQPGLRVDSPPTTEPGEASQAWSQDMQMGHAPDRPDNERER